MRILHVIASLAPRYGGPSQVCLELCRELARHGEHVAIYTTNIDGPEQLQVPLQEPVWQDGVEVHYFPVQAPRYYKFSVPLAKALKTAIPTYDIVHIHSLYLFPSTVAARYCRRFGVPYLIRPHGTLDPYLFRRHRGRKWLYEQLFEWRNLNRAAAIHFTSAEEQALTCSLGLQAPGVVVPNGVFCLGYAELPAAGTFRALWPETQGKQIILFLGRLHFKKGLDLLTQAFGQLGRTRNDVHLVVAGPDDDGYRRQVRRWLTTEGVAGKVTFTGMLQGEEKRAALRDATLFVLPSYSENFALAVVEAMAAGLPVVISHKVNIWREVATAKAGLVTKCDVRELHNALRALLDDPLRGKEMGQRGQQLVSDQFSWERVGRRMNTIYRQLLTQEEYRTAKKPTRRRWLGLGGRRTGELSSKEQDLAGRLRESKV